MLSRRHRTVRRVAGLAAVALPVLAACATPASAPAPPRSPVQAQLDRLPVAPGNPAGYDDAQFGTDWARQPQAGKDCDTRAAVLLLQDPEARTGKDCTVTSGQWHSYYDGNITRNPQDVDIDHVVSKQNAWASGARDWSPERRKAFANDLKSPELVAVTDRLNQQKHGAAADSWRPPNPDAWCRYATDQVAVKDAWGLSATASEKGALEEMLARC